MSSLDPTGQVSLMLCESILHLLVEEGVITKEKALEAIDGVMELGQGSTRPAKARTQTAQ
jgi:hypothetical protein